jgi:hypothetical protein
LHRWQLRVRREWPCNGWTSKDFDEITAAHFSPKAQDHADIGLITSGICDPQ